MHEAKIYGRQSDEPSSFTAAEVLRMRGTTRSQSDESTEMLSSQRPQWLFINNHQKGQSSGAHGIKRRNK